MSAVCGDGIVEGDEGCDELDALDEDGCNVDCTVSGSLLWSWEPRDEYILRVSFDPDDALHALVGHMDGSLDVRRFDADGQIDEVFEVTAIEPAPGAPKGEDGSLDAWDLEATSEGAYVGVMAYWQTDEGFLIAGHVERLGAGGWVRPLEGGALVVGPRPAGGVAAVTIDDVLHAFDADGNESWVVDTQLSVRRDMIAIDGAVVLVASDRVVAYDDASGEELWSFMEPAPEFIFDQLSRSDDEIWLAAHRFPIGPDDSIFRLGLDGSLIEHLEIADGGFWHDMSASGNVVWRRDQDIFEPMLIEKLDADLEVLWAHEFGTDEGWQHLEVDGRGAVAAAKGRELRVLAP